MSLINMDGRSRNAGPHSRDSSPFCIIVIINASPMFVAVAKDGLRRKVLVYRGGLLFGRAKVLMSGRVDDRRYAEYHAILLRIEGIHVGYAKRGMKGQLLGKSRINYAV